MHSKKNRNGVQRTLFEMYGLPLASKPTSKRNRMNGDKKRVRSSSYSLQQQKQQQQKKKQQKQQQKRQKQKQLQKTRRHRRSKLSAPTYDQLSLDAFVVHMNEEKYHGFSKDPGTSYFADPSDDKLSIERHRVDIVHSKSNAQYVSVFAPCKDARWNRLHRLMKLSEVGRDSVIARLEQLASSCNLMEPHTERALGMMLRILRDAEVVGPPIIGVFIGLMQRAVEQTERYSCELYRAPSVWFRTLFDCTSAKSQSITRSDFSPEEQFLRAADVLKRCEHRNLATAASEGADSISPYTFSLVLRTLERMVQCIAQTCSAEIMRRNERDTIVRTVPTAPDRPEQYFSEQFEALQDSVESLLRERVLFTTPISCVVKVPQFLALVALLGRAVAAWPTPHFRVKSALQRLIVDITKCVMVHQMTIVTREDSSYGSAHTLDAGVHHPPVSAAAVIATERLSSSGICVPGDGTTQTAALSLCLNSHEVVLAVLNMLFQRDDFATDLLHPLLLTDWRRVPRRQCGTGVLTEDADRRDSNVLWRKRSILLAHLEDTPKKVVFVSKCIFIHVLASDMPHNMAVPGHLSQGDEPNVRCAEVMMGWLNSLHVRVLHRIEQLSTGNSEADLDLSLDEWVFDFRRWLELLVLGHKQLASQMMRHIEIRQKWFACITLVHETVLDTISSINITQ